jgi:carboxypeptidase C (cathepsin A)
MESGRIDTERWYSVLLVQEANLLIIESPAGVGFSYVTDFNYTIGDEQVAADNYAALLEFYRLYPQFKVVDLYLTGESYAGVYIPMFGDKILNGNANFTINFKV